ncbi:MAG: hypothetical protein EHM49_02790 [Deltaproteobacteria bacterium]|nr:MAG: hypothetical protein EHM49_02790 [Deltaproteobacteria bacterium]
MKRVYELDVYKLSEELSDMVWQDFEGWNKKVQTRLPTLGNGGQNTVGQTIRSSTVQKHEGQISNFQFLISPFRKRAAVI